MIATALRQWVTATALIALALPALGRLERPEAFGAGPVATAEARRPPAVVPAVVGSMPAVGGVADARS
jgi:hypothetical protein